MSALDPDDRRPDPDADERTEALHLILRRTLQWAVPLTLIGLLLTALGIPWWISVVAILIVAAVAIFELD